MLEMNFYHLREKNSQKLHSGQPASLVFEFFYVYCTGIFLASTHLQTPIQKVGHQSFHMALGPLPRLSLRACRYDLATQKMPKRRFWIRLLWEKCVFTTHMGLASSELKSISTLTSSVRVALGWPVLKDFSGNPLNTSVLITPDLCEKGGLFLSKKIGFHKIIP